jgi:hypothetical protein
MTFAPPHHWEYLIFHLREMISVCWQDLDLGHLGFLATYFLVVDEG